MGDEWIDTLTGIFISLISAFCLVWFVDWLSTVLVDYMRS